MLIRRLKWRFWISGAAPERAAGGSAGRGGARRGAVQRLPVLQVRRSMSTHPMRPTAGAKRSDEAQIVAQARRMIDAIRLQEHQAQGRHAAAGARSGVPQGAEEAFPGNPLRIDPNGTGRWTRPADGRTAARRPGVLRRPDAGLGRHGRLHRRTGLPAGDQHGGDRLRRVSPQRCADSVQIVLATTTIGAACATPRRWRECVTSLAWVFRCTQLAPRHQPDGDVARRRRRAQLGIRLTRITRGRNRMRRSSRAGRSPSEGCVSIAAQRVGRGTRSRPIGKAARTVPVLRHPPA